jgi:opacity protein-like surface antigen
MKYIVIIVLTISAFFINTTSFAKGGFSLGMFGAYTTDGGSIEDTVHDAESADIEKEVKSEKIIIPGMGLFAKYEFKNNLFLRTGLEAYKMISGGEIDIVDDSTPSTTEYTIDYFAAAIPLYLGIKVTPDKGKTNIYGAFGLVIAIVDINWERHEVQSGPLYYDWEWKDDDMVIGLGGLFGVERAVITNFYLMIEYAFYKCDDSKDTEIEYNNNGTKTYYNRTNRFGLPRQQIRLGLRYNF